ncbi:stabilizer of axonemal microtubules 4 [Calonectris borealis]|uniref:stabilizer of axonemal microtubules 4 n=1 Tax=Calonectris borealis TaxID=1323832 RepID=UPI003F4B4035
MASACPFVCPRAQLPSLLQDSPAVGLGAVSPSAKARGGGSADLMNFYATSSAVAHGRGSRRPPRRWGGLVPGAEPLLPAVTQASHVSVPASATTLAPATRPTTTRPSPACSARAAQQGGRYLCCGGDGVQVLGPLHHSHADLLPQPLPGHRHVHHRRALQAPLAPRRPEPPAPARPPAGERVPPRVLPFLPPQRGSESLAQAASPGPPQSIQGAWHREPPHWSCPARCPAEDDHRRQGAVRLHQGHLKERRHPARPAGPAREPQPPVPPQPPTPSATPRDAFSLPQLGVSITATDYLPFAHSHGNETLPALPAGSKRGSGFSREVPGCLDAAGLPAAGHPIPLVSRGPQAPRVTQASPGRKEPSGFTTNHGQYVTPHPTLSPAAPARCWRGPTWTARPMGGIQPQRPSGFGTNNHPTGWGTPSATPWRGPPGVA